MTTIVGATQLQGSSPSPILKSLIFGELKEKALIYILTEVIYFPLSFAWGIWVLDFLETLDLDLCIW
jgi:hypothetical protein